MQYEVQKPYRVLDPFVDYFWHSQDAPAHERERIVPSGTVELVVNAGPMFASIKRGALHLLLSGPGSSGSRPLADSRTRQPGGWNRIVLDVDDLEASLAILRQARVRLRNDVEVGPGGKQIQVEDPDGNPIELHEAPRD